MDAPLDTLSREEMAWCLDQPSETPSGLRDKAMLELYAAGLRVSELAGLTMNSINWQGLLIVLGKGGKERESVGKKAYDSVRRH